MSVREKGPVTSADPSSGVPMTTGPITELINNPSKTTNPSTVTVVEENAPDATATNLPGDQSGPAAESSDANNDDEYEWYARRGLGRSGEELCVTEGSGGCGSASGMQGEDWGGDAGARVDQKGTWRERGE